MLTSHHRFSVWLMTMARANNCHKSPGPSDILLSYSCLGISAEHDIQHTPLLQTSIPGKLKVFRRYHNVLGKKRFALSTCGCGQSIDQVWWVSYFPTVTDWYQKVQKKGAWNVVMHNFRIIPSQRKCFARSFVKLLICAWSIFTL